MPRYGGEPAPLRDVPRGETNFPTLRASYSLGSGVRFWSSQRDHKLASIAQIKQKFWARVEHVPKLRKKLESELLFGACSTATATAAAAAAAGGAKAAPAAGGAKAAPAAGGAESKLKFSIEGKNLKLFADCGWAGG